MKKLEKYQQFAALYLLLGMPTLVFAAEARFISQLVPESVAAGQEFNILIQYRNISGQTWQSKDGIILQASKSKGWGNKQIKMQEKTVRKGGLATFQMTLKAPLKAGSYPFQWQLRNVRHGWRAAKTPELLIKVNQFDRAMQSKFLIQKIPRLQKGNEFFAILKRGQVYPVTLIFKNRGTQRWPANRVSLNIKHRQDNSVWSVNRVSMKAHENIAPGEVKAFHFNIIAPLEPGIYPFQWQLKNGPSWFGEPSDKVTITVQ